MGLLATRAPSSDAYLPLRVFYAGASWPEGYFPALFFFLFWLWLLCPHPTSPLKTHRRWPLCRPCRPTGAKSTRTVGARLAARRPIRSPCLANRCQEDSSHQVVCNIGQDSSRSARAHSGCFVSNTLLCVRGFGRYPLRFTQTRSPPHSAALARLVVRFACTWGR